MFIIEKKVDGKWIKESENHKGYSSKEKAERIGAMLYGSTFIKGFFRIREV